MELIRILQISFVFILYGEWSTATVTSSISNRSTPKTVDIAMFTDSSAPGKTFSVFVDSTMTRLIVVVKVDRSNPVLILAKPSGLPGPLPKLNSTTSTGTVTSTLDVAITAADNGIWKLTKLDANTWNVKVQGESPLDFSYQFLVGTMFKMPVTGDPIQGKDYTAVITVPEYATIQKVDMILEFVIEKFTPANMFPPSDLGGGRYQVASIKMLNKDFMIGIQGHDRSGHFFRRIAVIKPIAMILYVPSFAGVKLYENTNLDIPFSVVNKLSTDQDIDVGIKDTQGFAQAPKFISATLKPDQNFTGKFVIRGGLLGLTTTVTITAKPYLGRRQVSHGPSEVRQFTVENNQTTSTSTSTSTASSSLTNFKSKTSTPSTTFGVTTALATSLTGVKLTPSTTFRVTTPLATSSTDAKSTLSSTLGVTPPLTASSTGAKSTPNIIGVTRHLATSSTRAKYSPSTAIGVTTPLSTSSKGVISTHSTTFRVTTPIVTSSTDVESTPSTIVGVATPIATSSTSVKGTTTIATGTITSKTLSIGFKSAATNVGVTTTITTSSIKAMPSSTAAVTNFPASTISLSAPLVSSSPTSKYPPDLSQVASKTTPASDKNDFFAIISAIVFKSRMNTGKTVADSKQISISESIKFSLP